MFVFFFNDTATTEIYTLSLHDALPILYSLDHLKEGIGLRGYGQRDPLVEYKRESFDLFTAMKERVEAFTRSEEHTSELQSHLNLVCRLLLETKITSDSRLAFFIRTESI